MALPSGTYPIGGPLISTLGEKPAPSTALRDAGVVLLVAGGFEKVNSAGDAWEPATLSSEQLQDMVAAFMREGDNIVIAYDDDAGTLTISSTAAPGGGGLTAEEVRDLIAAFVGGGTGVTVTHNDVANSLTISVDTPFTAAEKTKLAGIAAGAEANVGEEYTTAEKTKLAGVAERANFYVLPAATEGALGGVRNVSVGEASDPAGLVFRAWSSAMITKVIALWRVAVSQAEAEGGVSTVLRFWSAQRVRQAINAVVPAVFRVGNTARIDPAKLGSGTRGRDKVLHGDGAWLPEASGLMREVFNDQTGANTNEQNLGITVPDSNNVILLISIGGVHEFIAGDDFVILRESDAYVVNGVTIYSDTNESFLIKQSAANSLGVRIWEIEDAEAFGQIAARFLPTVDEATAEDGTNEQRRIWNSLRVWQAARAATGDSIVGGSRSGQTLTLRRRNGMNPDEIPLPAGGGGGVSLEQVGSRFTHSGADEDGVWHTTGITLTGLGEDDIAYIRSASPDDSDPPQYNIIRGETFDALTVKADGDSVADGDTRWTRYWPGSATGIEIARTAAGELLAAGHGGASSGWWVELYRPASASDNARSGLVDIGRWVPAADVGSSPVVWQATGIMLPSDPSGEALFEWFASIQGQSINGALRGKDLEALNNNAAGAGANASNGRILRTLPLLYASKTSAGELLVASSAGFESDTDYVYLYRIQTDAAYDLPSGYLFYARPALVVPENITTDTVFPNSGDGLKYQLLNAVSVPGRVYVEVDFISDWFGGFNVDIDNNGVLETRLRTTHAFNGKSFTIERIRTTGISRNRDQFVSLSFFDSVSKISVGTYRTPAGSDIEITEADLLGPIDLSFEIELRMLTGAGARQQDVNLTGLIWRDPQFIGYQIAHGDAGPQPVPSPSITEFTVAGDLTPTAGDIGGEEYSYSTAIAHASRVSAARIVGFAGTMPGGAVTVLKDLVAADFHAASGTFSLPSPLNLAAGESYTTRLEVYGTGQTPGTDEAVTHQDRRITTHAPTAAVQFFRIPRRVGDPPARPDASTLLANLVAIGTHGSVIGTWDVTGIPDDNQIWLVGWVVPEDLTQPSHYTVGGINNDHAVDAPFDLSANGIDYKVYLFIDDAGGDESFNGVSIVVT